MALRAGCGAVSAPVRSIIFIQSIIFVDVLACLECCLRAIIEKAEERSKKSANGTALHVGVAQSSTHSALRFGGGGGGGAPRGLRRGVGAGPLERAAAAVGAWEIGVEKGGGVVVLEVQSMGDREGVEDGFARYRLWQQRNR